MRAMCFVRLVTDIQFIYVCRAEVILDMIPLLKLLSQSLDSIEVNTDTLEVPV